MKSFKYLSLSFFTLATIYTASSQTLAQRIKNTTLVFGLSEHIVIDNGKEYQFKFDTKSWQLTPFPSRLTAEAYLKKGWALQTEFAYTGYKANSTVDNVVLLKSKSFFSADLNLRYHFETLFHTQSFFDPFIVAGYGFTYRSAVNKTQTSIGTSNLGLGMNFWVYKGFGISLQSVGKFSLKGGTRSNYLHHSIGVVYKLKPLSGKPVLKTAR